MAESREAEKAIAESTCVSGNGREIERRRSHPQPGTYALSCVICGGQGTVWTGASLANPDVQLADPPYRELCLTCDGLGYHIVDGEREGDSDRRTQPTWGDVLWFSLCSMVITALGCWLLIWKAKGH